MLGYNVEKTTLIPIDKIKKDIKQFKENCSRMGLYNPNTDEYIIPKVEITDSEKKKLLSFRGNFSTDVSFKEDFSWIFINMDFLISDHLLEKTNGHFGNLTSLARTGIPKYDLELALVRNVKTTQVVEQIFRLLEDPDLDEKKHLPHILGALKYIELLELSPVNLDRLKKYKGYYTRIESILITSYEHEDFFSKYLFQMGEFRRKPTFFLDSIRNPNSSLAMAFKDMEL